MSINPDKLHPWNDLTAMVQHFGTQSEMGGLIPLWCLYSKYTVTAGSQLPEHRGRNRLKLPGEKKVTESTYKLN